MLDGILQAAGRAQVKGVLRHQGTIAGIGNAYSDELLHAAKMSPFKPAVSITGDDLQTLYDAIRTVLGDAVDRSRGLHAADLKGEKKSNLAVHGRTGMPCPVCGDTVREVSFADSVAAVLPDLPDRRQAARRPADVQAAQVALSRPAEERQQVRRRRPGVANSRVPKSVSTGLPRRRSGGARRRRPGSA